ncbi:rhomboid family intramembrane serine protease [Blattabacterium cuenoti]|uniref:rhomboid family intramembrane serine protease n=1 Tax=Blattabacterium cuenoti TaxID=1653831 RepID=UPI00163CBC2F|nr:rhomboid family intramembrane serine protease [Blattabacterium cuenoti]
MYTAIFVFSQYKIEDIFSLYNPLDEKFKIFQIFTHMFVHSKNIFFHIIFNMVALLMFGCQMETLLGFKKFIMLYFISGLFAALFQISFNTGAIFYFMNSSEFTIVNKILYYLNEDQRLSIYNFIYSPIMGASGAISGVLGAFAKFFPEHKIFILPFPFPIKVRKAIMIFIFGSFLSSIFNFSPGIAHFAHIGGITSGYLIGYIFKNKKI